MSPSARAAVALTVLAVTFAGPSRSRSSATPSDPLAVEISRWVEFARSDTASDDASVQVRRATATALAQASDALAHGRREYALLRLQSARELLAALPFVRTHAAAARSPEALEAEWKRQGPTLGAPAPTPAALARLAPASLRGMAEAAAPQARVYYDASLDYARATEPRWGLFYLGQANAQLEFQAFARILSAPPRGREPAFRSLAPELQALQSEMLAVYRPPVSIDRHGEFIGASSALKEARALDAAGYRCGALLRYLQAELRFQPLRGTPPRFDAATTPRALDALAARLGDAAVDHSLGRVFLEAARADAADTAAAATHAIAAAIADVVLPRYFAALEPASPQPPRAAAQVTVTLVRWPYT